MEFTLYILVIVLVIVKIIIWSCVCYTRSKRLRTARQRIIIVQSPQAAVTRQVHDQHGIIRNEHIPSIQDTYGGITNPQLATFAPPSYDDVVRTPLEAIKPPSYEQVIKEHQQIGATQGHGSK
ncbi:hypothetical protein ACJMK2_009136 [Sinanodonta woodiana]|uniref:Secreted protein n=1 Tax=Sinanodonta woodiana TaxID=1069815 RepID=A0ABD3VBD3_SINWO